MSIWRQCEVRKTILSIERTRICIIQDLYQVMLKRFVLKFRRFFLSMIDFRLTTISLDGKWRCIPRIEHDNLPIHSFLEETQIIVYKKGNGRFYTFYTSVRWVRMGGMLTRYAYILSRASAYKNFENLYSQQHSKIWNVYSVEISMISFISDDSVLIKVLDTTLRVFQSTCELETGPPNAVRVRCQNL